MKRNPMLPALNLALPVVLIILLAGCNQLFDSAPEISTPIDLPQEIYDDPDQGIMTKETADKIFNWISNSGKVTIQRFTSSSALEDYLKGTDGFAAEDPTRLFIKTIGNKPVNKIAGGAFSPDPGGAADISSVVRTLRLSDEITVINRTAFSGIPDRDFTLEIPKSVLDQLAQDVLTEIAQSVTVKIPDKEDDDPSQIVEKVIDIGDFGEDLFPVMGGTPVKEIRTEQYTGTVSWSNAPVVFAPGTSYSATIYITPEKGFTLTGVGANFFKVTGAKTSNNPDTGVVTAVFPKTAIPVDDPAALNAAIAQIEQDDTIQLTESFYSFVNIAGNPLTIHAGATDNTIAYTIRGLGTRAETPPNPPALMVGILIANDNITLKDISFEINDSRRAVYHGDPDEGFSNNYCSAIAIARAEDNAPSFLTGPDLPSRNVTVDNCDITFTAPSNATPFTSGIYVASFIVGMEPPPRRVIPYLPQGIVIENSSVDVTGAGTKAVQALIIPPTVRVTNNTLTARGGNGKDSAPACGIFIKNVFASSADQTIAPMTGNILRGDTFDFWIMSPFESRAVVDNDLNGTSNMGTVKMAALGFGTGDGDRIWAFDSAGNANNNYYKLLQALKTQCDEENAQGEVGYGRIFTAMVVTSGSQEIVDGIEEKYEIKNGQITAIDYWGYPHDGDGGYEVFENNQFADINGRIGGNGKYHNNRSTPKADGRSPYN
jgi:hypothetical protein